MKGDNAMVDKQIFKLCEVSEYYHIPLTTLQKHVREEKLIAKKNGREYIVTKENLDKYLGTKSSNKEMEKDLEIEKLKSELRCYKIKVKTFKNLIQTMENVLNNDKGEEI